MSERMAREDQLMQTPIECPYLYTGVYFPEKLLRLIPEKTPEYLEP